MASPIDGAELDAGRDRLTALTVTLRRDPAPPLFCLALVVDYDGVREGVFDLGGYGFLCRSATDRDATLEYVLPLRRELDRRQHGEPSAAYRPEQGWMDTGLSLDRRWPPPAPLLFDIAVVPPGTWWVHTASLVTPVEVWRP